MAATINGFETNEMKAQPGLSISRSESGGYTATHEIVIKASDLAVVSANFNRGTLLAVVDPDVPAPYDDFLYIDTVTFVRSEGDLYTFNITASGGTAQYDDDELAEGVVPNYTLAGVLYDAPFSKHRKWTPLDAADKKLLGMLLDGQLIYDIADGILYLTNDVNAPVACVNQLTANDAKEFAARIQQGETTYQKSVYTWNETTEGEDQLTPAQINNLGQISTPRGSPPTANGTRDWMLTNISQSQSGLLYRTSIEWTLSDVGGHDSFLYDT